MKTTKAEREVNRRRFAILGMRRRAVEARLAKVEPHTPVEGFRRADGNSVCEACSEPYREHPEHPSDRWLTILCDGSLVKL
jgi:hypothetical protein